MENRRTARGAATTSKSPNRRRSTNDARSDKVRPNSGRSDRPKKSAVSTKNTEQVLKSKASQSANAKDAARRKKTKAKAEKMYTRQFGKESLGGGAGARSATSAKGGEATAGSGSPRPALYKAKMGSSHKKASKMQSPKGQKSRLSIAWAIPVPTADDAKNLAGSVIAKSTITPRAIRVITFLACLVLVCFFLYTPTQQYYHALRENDRLAAEYDSVVSRNVALDNQNDMIASEAGLEDAVRQKYGYVKRGESKAVVLGLSDDTTDPYRDSEAIEANVLASAVKAPQQWYTPYLDALFGVE